MSDAEPKPPIGVKPRWLVEADRIADLCGAIHRYHVFMQDNRSLLTAARISFMDGNTREWADELRALLGPSPLPSRSAL